jgi:hypothetical protein
MHNNAATNPDHGGGAGGAKTCQEAGHTENKGTSECAAYTGSSGTVVVSC